MGLNAHCLIMLHEVISDLDSWDCVDAKNGVTCQDWTKDTRDIHRLGLKMGPSAHCHVLLCELGRWVDGDLVNWT